MSASPPGAPRSSAHRLTTTLRADRVLVLQHGRIVEEGAPAELLARAGGRYQRMMRLFRHELHTKAPDPCSGAAPTPCLSPT